MAHQVRSGLPTVSPAAVAGIRAPLMMPKTAAVEGAGVTSGAKEGGGGGGEGGGGDDEAPGKKLAKKKRKRAAAGRGGSVNKPRVSISYDDDN